ISCLQDDPVGLIPSVAVDTERRAQFATDLYHVTCRSQQMRRRMSGIGVRQHTRSRIEKSEEKGDKIHVLVVLAKLAIDDLGNARRCQQIDVRRPQELYRQPY